MPRKERERKERERKKRERVRVRVRERKTREREREKEKRERERERKEREWEKEKQEKEWETKNKRERDRKETDRERKIVSNLHKRAAWRIWGSRIWFAASPTAWAENKNKIINYNFVNKIFYTLISKKNDIKVNEVVWKKIQIVK